MSFSIITSPSYYNVTHFLTDLNEIRSVYIKLKIKHFVPEKFLILRIFIEKITIYYENHVYSAVTLHLSLHPLWAVH